jgi:hypothetical protein
VKIRTILGVLVLLASGQANASLIINGGFEEPIVDRPSLNYEHRNGFELTGWESFSTYTPANGDDPGSVHFNSSYDAVSEGNQAVQLEAPGDWIRQSFATVTDQWYLLSFDLSAFQGSGTGFLGVDVGNASQQFSGTSIGYESHTLQFMALSDTTTLTFTNIGSFFTYPHIDNVAVNVVPIPATVWLFGTALIGLIGFTKRRKAA